MGWKPPSSSDDTEAPSDDVRPVLKKPAAKNQNKDKSEDTETENVMKKPAAKKDNQDRNELFKGGLPDDTNDGSGSDEHDGDDDEEPKKKPAAMKSLNLSFCKHHQTSDLLRQLPVGFCCYPFPFFREQGSKSVKPAATKKKAGRPKKAEDHVGVGLGKVTPVRKSYFTIHYVSVWF